MKVFYKVSDKIGFDLNLKFCHKKNGRLIISTIKGTVESTEFRTHWTFH
jgi:hypothetical protein